MVQTLPWLSGVLSQEHSPTQNRRSRCAPPPRSELREADREQMDVQTPRAQHAKCTRCKSRCDAEWEWRGPTCGARSAQRAARGTHCAQVEGTGEHTCRGVYINSSGATRPHRSCAQRRLRGHDEGAKSARGRPEAHATTGGLTAQNKDVYAARGCACGVRVFTQLGP